MKFLFLESFFGGSHRDFAEGLKTHSAHHIDLVTLPARFWKWRMRGAALYFSEKIPSLEGYHGLITTDLMSLSDFRTLNSAFCPAALAYFHENQITYPLAPGEQRDVQFGFTDITTALAAKRILFNSRTHYNAFFDALPGFIKKMPEYRPLWSVEAIRSKSGVLHPGCQFPTDMTSSSTMGPDPNLPPLVIWNHRWEFDKNPSDFFDALTAVSQRGRKFRLALLGENFQTVPKAFIAARDQFGDRIVQYGYEKSKTAYQRWLQQGAIVVSTANQENFGISIVEAIRYGNIPLLPDRLTYPEIIPKKFHPYCLYRDRADLVEKLAHTIDNIHGMQTMARELSHAMDIFSWETLIDRYDRELTALATAPANDKGKPTAH